MDIISVCHLGNIIVVIGICTIILISLVGLNFICSEHAFDVIFSSILLKIYCRVLEHYLIIIIYNSFIIFNSFKIKRDSSVLREYRQLNHFVGTLTNR